MGFEPTAPGFPRFRASLEGRCFEHQGFEVAGAVQAELRARYAHTGLFIISTFLSSTRRGAGRALFHIDCGPEGLRYFGSPFRVVLFVVRFIEDGNITLELLAKKSRRVFERLSLVDLS